MDASLQQRAEQLAKQFAGEARTAEELNGFMRLMMKSALERMLNTELDVHLGRKGAPAAVVTEGATSEARNTLADQAAETPQWSLVEDRARRPGRADHRHAP